MLIRNTRAAHAGTYVNAALVFGGINHGFRNQIAKRRRNCVCCATIHHFHTTALQRMEGKVPEQNLASFPADDMDQDDGPLIIEDPSTKIIHEMRKYATQAPLRQQKVPVPTDDEQTHARNNSFLRQLKAILKREAEEEAKQASTNADNASANSSPNRHKQLTLTASIIDLYHQNFESAKNCNQQPLSVYTHNRRNQPKTPRSQSVVPPNKQSLAIICFPFQHDRFRDFFDFHYFVTNFLYDIFLYQLHLFPQSFIFELLHHVVTVEQMIDEGLILFQLYANHVNLNRDDLSAKNHLFKCYVHLLRESIRHENSFAMKALLEYGEKHYRDTMMESFDEKLTEEHQNQLCICLMDLYARSGDLDAALRLLKERILTPRITSETLNQVLTTLLTPYTTTLRHPYTLEERKGMVSSILDKVPEAKIHDVVIVDMILGWYIEDRNWTKCRELIERLYNLNEGLNGEISTLPHDTRVMKDGRLAPVYMSLIKIFLVYASFGEAHLLEQYYTKVVHHTGRKDHVRLANFILLAHLQANDPQKSLLRFQELFVSKWQVSPKATCIPDLDTWKIVMQASKAVGATRMYEQVAATVNVEMMKRGERE